MMTDVADLLLPIEELDLCSYQDDDDEEEDEDEDDDGVFSDYPEDLLEVVFRPYCSSESDDGVRPPFDPYPNPLLPALSPPVANADAEFLPSGLRLLNVDGRCHADDPFLESLDPDRSGVIDNIDDMGSADYHELGFDLGLGTLFDDSGDEDGGLRTHPATEIGGRRDPGALSLAGGDDLDPPDLYGEWEEVYGDVDERDVLSSMIGGGDSDTDYDRDGSASEDHELEVLSAIGRFERNPSDVGADDLELYLDDDLDDLVLFGHFSEQEGALRGGLPAAKSIVESLPSIGLTEEDVANNNNICPVCKDEISLREKARQLPCLHHYHGDCILPWLEMRNTCPVCRYPLQTHEPTAESPIAGRHIILASEFPARYGFRNSPDEVDDPQIMFN